MKQENALRPELDIHLDADIFLQYYYLKEELIAFCRKQGLSASGGKEEITERIAVFLKTGKKIPAVRKQRKKPVQRTAIRKEDLIEAEFVCTQTHRAFFEQELGSSFSFYVAFQQWLKANAGKTYAEALEAYETIQQKRTKETTVIDRQFEYNTYIRAFFAANKDYKFSDAIKCWKYKKQQKGSHLYEDADLIVLLDHQGM